MIQKRGYAGENGGDEVSLPKRSRPSTSPPLDSVNDRGGNTASLSGGGNRTNGHQNQNDDDEIEEEDDEDYTSSSGSSSDDDDQEEDEDEENDEESLDHETKNAETIPYIPGQPKPKISRPPNSDLLSRISSFLPQLEAANADIEQRLARGESLDDMILDDVKDDAEEAKNGEGKEAKQYIEMNLGLGVLKEKKKKRQPGDISLGDESSSDSAEEDEDVNDGTAEDGEGQVLDQLMGLKGRSKQKSKTKPVIQEVDEG